MVKEEWRPVVGYEGLYEVSNKGRVRSLERKVPYVSNGLYRERTQSARMMRLQDKHGYKLVGLWKDGKGKTQKVHRLVAMAFIPNPDPERKQDINHLDEVHGNNCVENLEWCTRAENLAYGTARERGRQTQIRDWAEGKRRNQYSKCREFGQYTLDGRLVRTFMSTRDAERTLGKSNGSIWKVLNGQGKTAYGYRWEYLDG